MKDFICADVNSKLDKLSIFKILSKDNDFSWRMGDSDALGGYISGYHKSDNIKVQLWTSETPMEFSISLRGSSLETHQKEEIVQRLILSLTTVGHVLKLDES